MIKAALEYITGLKEPRILELEQGNFSDKQLHRVKCPRPVALQVSSLDSFVDYIKSNFDTVERLMVHVKSPTKISLFTDVDEEMERDVFMEATALLPNIEFDRFVDTENFNIMLQSCFVDTEDKAAILAVVGNISESTVQTIGDDGVSQSVVARKGIATKENVIVPNPVVLQPYRTFVEVAQPPSNFIFRMKDGPRAAIFEADGGAWKLAAVRNIKKYLEEKLKEQVESGRIIIIA